MDHADARQERHQPLAAPAPKPPAAHSQDEALLELQRTAGNRAVTEALTSVQRHQLNPENIEELPST